MIPVSYDWNRLFMGTITKIFNPQDSQNPTKYQYVYEVLITVDNYAQIPVKAIMLDRFGSFNNFHDSKLAVGYRVFLMFPRGDRSLGVILGGARLFPDAQDPGDGYYDLYRYNEIQVGIDKSGTWSVTADNGPSITLTKQTIVLNDQGSESITIDNVNKIITIQANDFTVNVQNAMQVTVQGDATITVAGDLTADVSGTATVKAPEIIFNEKLSGITTENSHYGVVDFVTGVPVIPSETTYGDI